MGTKREGFSSHKYDKNDEKYDESEEYFDDKPPVRWYVLKIFE